MKKNEELITCKLIFGMIGERIIGREWGRSPPEGACEESKTRRKLVEFLAFIPIEFKIKNRI